MTASVSYAAKVDSHRLRRQTELDQSMQAIGEAGRSALLV